VAEKKIIGYNRNWNRKNRKIIIGGLLLLLLLFFLWEHE